MLAVLAWWLAIELCGLLALPLAWRLFARLPGRGYPFAKALGLLLASYILWLGASFHILPNDLGGSVMALLALGGLALWLGGPGLRRDATGSRPLLQWLRANRGLVLATEALLAVAFVGWAIFRAYSGDIAATEKPMEFAFINGVLNSRFFPPQDPWLSGYAISYYYFGYVMLAFLIRITGVAPAVGFNLGVALWFALVLVGAFGVVYDLVALAGGAYRERSERSEPRESGAIQPERAGAEVPDEGAAPPGEPAVSALRPAGASGRALRWGFVAALFTAVLGNLEGLLEAGYNAGFVPQSFLKWLDINDLLSTPPTGNWVGTNWWWWHASRVINDRDLLGQHVEVIDEFPFFSFLLGDLHPHVLGLPFVLLAIALALNLWLAVRGWDAAAALARARAGLDLGESAAQSSAGALGVRAGAVAETRGLALLREGQVFWRSLAALTGLGVPGLLIYAVILGGLAFLNTWDFPIYLALVALAFGAGLAMDHGLHLGVAGRTLALAVTLGALGWLAYLPFYLGFQSQAGGILPNVLFPTRLSQLLVMFGLLLAVVVFFLALVTYELGRQRASARELARGPRVGSRFLAILPWVLLLPILLLSSILFLAAVMPDSQWLRDTLNNPAVRSHLPEASLAQLLGLIARVRLATPWTYLALALLVSWTGAVLWRGIDAFRSSTTEAAVPERPGLQPVDLFAVLLIALALLLTFSVEFVYLKDYFGTRMNTVFKFYYQAWILLALASAYGLSRLAERRTPVALQAPALLLAILLGAASLVYPLLATPSKAGDFAGPPTLDGLAYISKYNPGDAAAIAWLRQNVAPSAVVLEVSGGSYSPDGAERISMSTGNPTLLGWDFHEMQWRGKAYDQLAAGRKEAIDAIYRNARPEEIRALLEKWGIDYVYVGNLERNTYKLTDPALARFDRAGLHLVYDANGVHIYAR